MTMKASNHEQTALESSDGSNEQLRGRAAAGRCESLLPWRTPVVASAIGYGVLMLAFHVHAVEMAGEDRNESVVFERVQARPFGMSDFDLILFSAFVLLGMELLQFLVAGSGSKFIYPTTRVSSPPRIDSAVLGNNADLPFLFSSFNRF
jgi:hypothetical protein